MRAGAAGVVDSGVTLLGFDTIDGATVTINGGFVSAEDRLAFTNQNGIVGTYNASTGVLTLSGSASSAAYEAALRTVSYSNTNPNSNQLGPRTITFSVGAGTLFHAATGHFYQYVASPGISWHAARDAAAGRSLYGLQGYLATITSASENSFVTAKLAGRGWIGASDEAQEGVWRWVTGPEAGTHFSNQFKYTYNTCAAATAPALPGQYANWGGGEPNDCGSWAPGNHAEDYAHFYTNGTWNDFPSSAGVDGYVVEYGGMAGDAQPVLSASTTVDVVDGAPPVTTVTQAPTQPNGSVLVSLRATDNITLVPVTSYRIDGGPVQVGASPVVFGAGTHDLTFWSTDGAGNAEAPQTVQIYVDPVVVSPTVTAQTSPTGYTGRKAQLSGTAEPGSTVAVYLNSDPAYSNLALGKPVAQSSWYNAGSYPGTGAVDGLITGGAGRRRQEHAGPGDDGPAGAAVRRSPLERRAGGAAGAAPGCLHGPGAHVALGYTAGEHPARLARCARGAGPGRPQRCAGAGPGRLRPGPGDSHRYKGAEALRRTGPADRRRPHVRARRRPAHLR